MAIQAYQPRFEGVADAFTDCLRYAVDWRTNYDGLTTADKVAQCVIDLRDIIKAVSACHEMKGLV